MTDSRGSSLDDGMKDIIGTMMPLLNEYQRRIFVSVISENLGWGSAGEIAEFTGFSTQTLTRGRKEVEGLARDPKARTRPCEEGRVRAEGGGRRSKTEDDPRIVTEILKMLDGNTVGDPMSLLTWTTKSTRKISDELKALGIDVSYNIVNKVLKTEGFSLQQNKKYVQNGDAGPDRDAQFKFIKSECEAMALQGQPTISVDTKKKELVGNYKNGGREYRPKGDPRLVNDHDFEGEQGKAVPYGVYDVNANEGYVNVGIGPDTAEFAVNSIRTWWQHMGRERYRDAHVLMITADCGGSNGRRNRLWKTELQKLSDDICMEIRVRHYPPGTSKWNKIEHRMFSHISMNWAGRPLESLEVIVNLIGSTRSRSGLKIDCGLDTNDYMKGIKVTDEEMEQVNLFEDEFHGEWNYRILPHN